MDFEVSPQSVRSALSDLQLKVKLLEDERDHFHHLYLTTGRAFEDHRRELNLLLHKERNVAAASEERLRLDLQRVLSENTVLHTRVVESKSEVAVRIRTSVEEFRAEQRVREERIREEISMIHDQLLDQRRRCAALRDVKKTTEIEMTALLQQQSSLQSEVDVLHHTRFQLEEQIQIEALTADRARRSPVRPCQSLSSPSRHGKVPKIFIPSGRVENIGSRIRPSTHNIQAVVQTLEKTSQLQPRPYDGTRSGKQLDRVCRTIINELLDMKREYANLTDTLGSPMVDALEVSRRLRQLMYDIDRKTEQLRQLRRQQLRIDDDTRIHEMMKEILDEQGIYEDMHEELLRILRSTSS
ncbi:Hypothetical protein, putative [Bodo saltans]|uniref:Uncharacterized protein n=1 Tax=Bodo saltans TaxID=75058 RepID=A0A0S4IV22_BODSA|nr:Hypothetical protein, putative [Bodo saltans]|eukprot:CUG01740.1 Hypothetical protein, putative [Bodo saltans]